MLADFLIQIINNDCIALFPIRKLVSSYDGIYVGRTSGGSEIRCNGHISETGCKGLSLKSNFV